MRKHFKFVPKKGIVFKELEVEIISDKIIKRSNNVYFEVKCISCGKIYEKPQHSFFGRRITKCQCHKQYSSGYKGIGELSGYYFNRLKKGAESRGIEFNISKEYIWERFLYQNGKCNLTGLRISLQRNHRNHKLMTASLDRIDSNKGYTKDNVQWVHKDINKLKVNFSEEYLIKLCKLVVKYGKTNSRAKRD